MQCAVQSRIEPAEWRCGTRYDRSIQAGDRTETPFTRRDFDCPVAMMLLLQASQRCLRSPVGNCSFQDADQATGIEIKACRGCLTGAQSCMAASPQQAPRTTSHVARIASAASLLLAARTRNPSKLILRKLETRGLATTSRHRNSGTRDVLSQTLLLNANTAGLLSFRLPAHGDNVAAVCGPKSFFLLPYYSVLGKSVRGRQPPPHFPTQPRDSLCAHPSR